MTWTVAIVLVLGLGLGWMVVSFLFARRPTAALPPETPILPRPADEIEIPDPMLSDAPVEHRDPPRGDPRP